MKNLKLELEDLRVKSFETADIDTARGTVRAHVGLLGEEDTGGDTNCLSACYSQCVSGCWPTKNPCCITE